MENRVENLIDIIENKSKMHELNGLIGVCKRKNNSKRDFLFVNRYQGKHFPQNPSKILNLFDEFVENIKVNDEKILVIGFAETAIAIGKYVASKLPNCVFEIQTTRELFLEQKPIIEFKEEHSHATEQLLYGNKEIFDLVQTVLFVEDEITTGKTIVNFIEEIKKINSNLKFAVASILNLQDEDRTRVYRENEIDTYYLIKGQIKDITAKVDVNVIDEFEAKNDFIDGIKIYNVNSDICNLFVNRNGKESIMDSKVYSKYLFDNIVNVSNSLKKVCDERNKNILVLGTEEFMYEPLMFANYLEQNTNNNIFYHATTRSPIEVSEDDGYILKRRYKFNSCYDENRTTYLYNIGKYDKVYIVTDSNVTNKFVRCMSNIFSELGYNLNDVEIIKF